jgi:F-type H+-transporting ATPase subunit gamma
MLEVLSSLAARANPEKHPLLVRRPEEKVLLVVVAADKGLCGSFNTNIVNRARAVLDDLAASSGPATRTIQVDIVGRKARDWFRRRPYPVRRVQVDLITDVTLEDARGIATDLIEQFSSGAIDSVSLVYNEFKSVIQQRVVVEPLLPIPRGTFGPGAFEAADAVGLAPEDYIYEPDQEALFAALLPKHVMIQVHRVLLESAAAEHGARMTAMENATRNAGEMIDSLTLQMNKIRQASITKEILEVVSGAEALK